MSQQEVTLIFIHYFGGNGGSWKWLSKKLPKKLDCVFLTLPGFDDTKPLEENSIRSFSQWISDEIKARNIDRYILIGHSMGGKLALFTAFINHNCLPDKIILIAPSPPTTENKCTKEKKRMLNHPDRAEAFINVENCSNKKLNKKRLNYAVESQLNVNSATWKWWTETGMNNDISWAIKNLKIPTFVICSKNDPVISIDAIQDDLLPYLDKAKLITFGRSGHLIPLESPRKLAKVIKKIIKN